MTSVLNKLRLLRHKLLYGLLENRNVPTFRIGDPCVWDVCLNSLGKTSAIICAGAGNDISFEIGLHGRTGATVILLDPSPTGKQTLASTSREQLGGIEFLPLGLTAKSGVLNFAIPANPLEGSYALDEGTRETVSFECTSLEDLMTKRGLKRIDLLKMDIEGFEWEVLEAIMSQGLDVSQICVEFHPIQGRIRAGWERYLMLLRLRLRGYQLISHNGTGDHTFIRSDRI